MKKTLSMNLNGMVFNIDDDAYQALETYLADIASRFESDEDKNDIMSDIEARIAELLEERLQRSKEVVTMADVQDVIRIMGQPNQFADVDEPAQPASERKKKRLLRFYRDPETAVLGGVCGGLAARFGWDVLLVRLALVGITLLSMLVGGGWFFLLAYFLLWIIAPMAVTPSQRLEMQGEDVTVENIKAEFQNCKNYVESDAFKSSARSVGQRLGRVLGTVLKVVFGVLGALMLAVFVFVLFVMVLGFFSVGGALSIAGLAGFLPDLLSSFPAHWEAGGMLVLSGLLIVGCPVFALLYALVRGVSGHRSKSKTTYWVILLLWLAGIFMLIGIIQQGSWQMHMESFHETACRPATVVCPVSYVEERSESASEPLTEQLRDVPSFKHLNMKGCFEVEITQSPNRMLMLSAAEKRLPNIVTSVSGDTLYLSMRDGETYSFQSLHDARDVLRRNRVSVSVKNLESIHSDGVADIKALTPLKGKSFSLQLEGLSKADLQLDMKQEVRAHVEGMNAVALRGRCERVDVYVEGMSSVDAGNLQASHARLKSDGMCKIWAYATESVDATAEGVGKIVCYGKPARVNVSEDGLAKVQVK